MQKCSKRKPPPLRRGFFCLWLKLCLIAICPAVWI
nr:MAG TPA: hypothetical protein [Caudoviricetes sp.]